MILPALSGVLLALSFPPFALLLPPFVALVPLLVYVAERPQGPAGRWAATRAGLVAGAVGFALQLYWLAVALIHFSALAIPAFALTVLVLAALTGAVAWAVHFTRDRIGLPIALAGALFWTSMEWLQANLGDLSFPWLGLGTALAPYPRLAGAADLVGARGLTLWVAAVNGLLATALVRHRAGRGAAPALAAAIALFAAPAAYGFVRAATLEPRAVARVAVVQPNIPEDLKMDRARAVDSSMTALAGLTRRLEGQALDLVVWPEVALPAVLERSPRLARRVRELSRRVDAPILVGAYGTAADPADRTLYNSAFLVTTGAGAGVAGRYDKVRLVPFVERVPFVPPASLGRWARVSRYFGGLGRGRDAPLLAAGDARFGALICFESIFATLARRHRARGADFLVNLTNDAWYGREPWYERTTALWQHPAHLTLRAIETRTGIARAANTGISMFVDPIGRTYGRTALFEPAVRVADVLTTDGTTLFVRRGDWLASGAALAAVVALLAAALRPGAAGPPGRLISGGGRGILNGWRRSKHTRKT